MKIIRSMETEGTKAGPGKARLRGRNNAQISNALQATIYAPSAVRSGGTGRSGVYRLELSRDAAGMPVRTPTGLVFPQVDESDDSATWVILAVLSAAYQMGMWE